MGESADFNFSQAAPPVTPDPPHQKDDECREDIRPGVVADAACGVDLVDAADCSPATPGGRAVAPYVPERDNGIVVGFWARSASSPVWSRISLVRDPAT